MALTLLSFTFMGFLVIGVPVAFAIGLSSITAIMVEDLPLAVAFQQMTSGMNAFSFLAIPFFIFTGELMLYGGIADRIVAFAKSLVGHVRGGWACPTWWPARCSAVCRGRPWRMYRRWGP